VTAVDLSSQSRLLKDYRTVKSTMAGGSQAKWLSLLRTWRGQTIDQRVGFAQKGRSILIAFRQVTENVRASQVETAEDFRLLDLLGCETDELRHSRVLSWFLDRSGTHAQGRLGFRLFLEALSLPPSTAYLDSDYRCRCEVSGEESRIDIEVSARSRFIIHIENKLHASEGWQQLKRESADLERRARVLEIPPDRVHGYFLTPHGCMPAESGVFKPLRWDEVGAVFKKFSREARAPAVKWFALHFAEAVERLAASRPQGSDLEDRVDGTQIQ